MKVRAPILLALVVFCAEAFHVQGEELPLLGKLPSLDQEWLLVQQGTKKDRNYEYSWATFKNSITGDKLSFAADRYLGTVRTVTSSPLRQAAFEMFPGGLPMFIFDRPRNMPGWIIIDTLRLGAVPLQTGVDGGRKNVKTDALEFSYVYEGEEKGQPNLLGHGYAIPFGDTVLFVQHTSSRVIDSSEVKDMAVSMIRRRL